MVIRYIRKDLGDKPIDVCYAVIINGHINKRIVSFSDFHNVGESKILNEWADLLWWQHKNEPVKFSEFDSELMRDIGASTVKNSNFKHCNFKNIVGRREL